MTEYCEANFIENYQPDNDARVELKNGRFVDTINGRYIEPGARVIIQGGKILFVDGLSDEPADMTPDFTIDLQGRAVFPGLFNTHCHAVMTIPTGLVGWRDIRLSRKHHTQQLAKNMAECLAHGVTTIRDAWIPDLRRSRSLKEKISRREMPGPRIVQSVVVGPPGGYLSERPTFAVRLVQNILGTPLIDHERPESGSVIFPVDANESQVRDAVDRAVDERGAECIKIGEQLENMVDFRPTMTIMALDQLKALTDQARRRGLRTTMHHVSVESFRRGVEARVSSLAHAPFDAGLDQADVEAFNEADGIIEPTSTVAYDVCWKIKGDPFCDHPDMDSLARFREEVYMNLAEEYWIPELRDRVKKAYDKFMDGKLKALGFIDMSNMFKYYSGVISKGADNVRMLFEGSACLAIGNDGGVPPSTPAMIGHELRMLAFTINSHSDEAKFGGVDAVRAATINSARSLGLEDALGSIESGKIADLAVVDGDPLGDVSVVGSRVAALFVDGRLVIDNCGLRMEKAAR